ncbi:DUF882 domain-containing protein [Rhizobium sp. CG5]|uniref:D-Ala-D-Ala carboxypeptidase family metallohydrolase n=1 Tax=Rhizobium sp. CG5 TaxID=2726076 RepID=UPI002033A373|nr:D-Ala-D-Ala carboxypeptidase family metallohydrolase [Rhizobium sp. CG5]MCM2473384.1 DUF882 domain-containing protein [Rhizobium sp. CG5]
MSSEAQMLADQLFDEFLAAQSDADREAIRPAALAAAHNALAEAIASFRAGTAKILEISTKLEDAILKLGSQASRERLEAIAVRLGDLQRQVHDAEGMRTTWENTEEFETNFPDEDMVPASGQHGPIPLGATLDSDLQDRPLSTSRKFEDLADEYIRLFRMARYKDAVSEKAAKGFAEKAIAQRPRYQTVGQPLGIPWWFVAGVHLLESTYNFRTHLHNGDRLTARTFRVPAGRPHSGSPPFTWEFSAEDALRGEGLAGLADWSLARSLYRWEVFNGLGYRSRRIPTPYLWSFSTVYNKGKFVGDGVFSPTAVSQQCGAAVLLKALIDLGAVDVGIEIFTEGAGDNAESDTADAEAAVRDKAPNIDGTISTNTDFKSFFAARLPDIKHFQWHEFLIKGGHHAQNGLNTDPPRDLWPNIIPTARILERFREEVGHPVVITSAYRSPDYNKGLPGAAKNSQHMQFRAVDIKVPGAGTPAQWAAVLKRYRSEKMFEGGIGIYNTFVHVDTRGHNADW